MGIRFGLSRLLLINSGTYLEGHIPLDAAVSFCGPNNFGKSTGINALQFLMIPELKGAQFEKYTLDESRKFYFPTTSSYVLAEINTPTGIWVLGAAGFGPAQQYKFEHFTYQAKLNIDDYINDNRSIIAYLDFKRSMLLNNAINVHSLKPQEVAKALCGADNEKRINFGLVPVGSIERYRVFQQLWLSVITQKQIKAADIKRGLLQVFSLALSAHDEQKFEELRAQAFSDYDKQLRQLNALKYSENDIQTLSEKIKEGNASVWQIRYLYIYIEANTAIERVQLEERSEEVNEKIRAISDRQDRLHNKLEGKQRKKEIVTEESTRIKLWLEQHEKDKDKKKALLWASESDILSKLKNLEEISESLSAMVKSSGSYSLISAKENLKITHQKASNIKSILKGNPVLFSLITQYWNAESVADLSRLFNNEMLTLKIGTPESSDPVKIKENSDIFDVLDPVMKLIDNGILKFKSLELDVNSLPSATDLLDLNHAELEHKLRDIEKEINYWKNLSDTLGDLQNKKLELKIILENIKKTKEDLALWQKVEGSQSTAKRHQEDLKEYQLQIESLEGEIKQLYEEIKSISLDHGKDIAEAQKIGKQLVELTDLEKQIIEPQADWPEGIPAQGYVPPDSIVSCMRSYIQLTAYYKNIINQSNNLYLGIRNRGYRVERSFESEPDAYHHILQTWDAREEIEKNIRHQRLAGYYTIGAHYQGYLQDYNRLDDEIGKLNRVLKSRKISNLKEFKILIQPNKKLVNSLQAIVEASTTLEPGAIGNLNFEGINIDEAGIEAAIKLIHRAVSDSDEGDIRLEDLFEVGFHTVNKDGSALVHETLDKVGSTGTRLPLKILTMMFLMTHMVNQNNAKATIQLPYTIDEAADLDPENGRALIESSKALGFIPLLTSVNPVDLAAYAIDLSQAETGNGQTASLLIRPEHWWDMEKLKSPC